MSVTQIIRRPDRTIVVTTSDDERTLQPRDPGVDHAHLNALLDQLTADVLVMRQVRHYGTWQVAMVQWHDDDQVALVALDNPRVDAEGEVQAANQIHLEPTATSELDEHMRSRVAGLRARAGQLFVAAAEGDEGQGQQGAGEAPAEPTDEAGGEESGQGDDAQQGAAQGGRTGSRRGRARAQ